MSLIVPAMDEVWAEPDCGKPRKDISRIERARRLLMGPSRGGDYKCVLKLRNSPPSRLSGMALTIMMSPARTVVNDG